MTIDPTLIEKIRKVLALKASSNPNEAAVAAAKAAALLQEHNLTVADIEAIPLPEDIVELHQPVTDDEDNPQKHPWVMHLAMGIANSTFTHLLVSRNSVLFVGRSREAEAARTMFASLYNSMTTMVSFAMDEAAQKFRRERHTSYWDSLAKFNGSGKKKVRRDWRKSWLQGCAAAIYWSLAEQHRIFSQKPGATALVLHRKAEADNFVAEKYPDIKQVKSNQNQINRHAWLAGEEAGQKLAQGILSTKIDSPDAAKLLS